MEIFAQDRFIDFFDSGFFGSGGQEPAEMGQVELVGFECMGAEVFFKPAVRKEAGYQFAYLGHS